ncbi:MAG: response regulator [Thiotrichaceae bacterium]|nr:response regulator [Thiotrichaceae bacterium]
MKAKVLLIDDHTLFRVGLQDLLTRRGIDVIAAIGNGKEGLIQVEKLRPDVVLLDMRMPEMDGNTVLKAIKKQRPDQRVAMLTTSAVEQDLVESLRNGAQGYLLKDMEPDDLVVALRDIIAGKMIVANELSHVLARVVQGETIVPEEENDPFSELTPREYEILGLLAEGQTNKVIARNLGISDGTVKLHVKAILRKLKINSRITAAVMAVEHGLKKSNKNQY